MRVVIALGALTAALVSVPANAAPVFLYVNAYAYGQTITYDRCPQDQFQICQVSVVPEQRGFSFSDFFDFNGGVATFSNGFIRASGELKGTIVDLGDGRYEGRDFTFGAENFGAGTPPPGGQQTFLRASSFNVAAVPEPASWALMIMGLSAAGAALRRRVQVRVSWAA